ncbi:MAG: hypothetical protein U0R80_00605 [Nocardioidaceae bacterium]
MGEGRAAELDELKRTYAKQVDGFDALLERIRDLPLGDAPLHLEAERMWPHGE